MSLLLQSRRFCTQNVSVMKRVPILSQEQRFKAEREFRVQVSEGLDCFSYQIESYMENLKTNGQATEADLIALMKGCQRDILDYFPKDQKNLTSVAYETIKQVYVRDTQTSKLHSSVLDAFLFQNVAFKPQQFLSELESYYGPPNTRILEKIIGYYCNNQEFDEAMKIFDCKENGLSLNDKVAQFLIFGLCARGDYVEAEKLLANLESGPVQLAGSDKQHKPFLESFIIGAAANNNTEKLDKYLQEIVVGDQALLDALMYVSGTENESIILDKLPASNSYNMSLIVRRPLKQLIENNYLETAENLLLKTEELKINSTTKERVMRISPSVIYLQSIITAQTDSEKLLDILNKLFPVDSKILERSIILLVDLSFDDRRTKNFCNTMIKSILTGIRAPDFQKNVRSLLSQNISERIKEAETEEQVIYILNHTSHLGLKLTHMKEWLEAMRKLLPPQSTQKEFIERSIGIVQNLSGLYKVNRGLYKEGYFWSYIIKHLFMCRTQDSFSAADKLIKDKGVEILYKPRRFAEALGDCLLITKDVVSFVNILEAFFKHGEVQKSFYDYREISLSIPYAVNVAQKANENIDELLEALLQECWTRKILIHQDIRDILHKQIANECLREVVMNLPALTFKAKLKKNLNKKPWQPKPPVVGEITKMEYSSHV